MSRLQYCFPPQSQVISACAELAKRVVNGGPVHDDSTDGMKNGKVDNWFKAVEKPKEKEDIKKQGRTLVVVGLV